MSRRRSTTSVLVLSAMLHVYIGARLLPDMSLSVQGWALAVSLLAISTILVPTGIIAKGLGTQRLSDRLAWVGLTTMGLFSSLMVLTLVRDAVLTVLALLGESPAGFPFLSAVAVPVLALLITLAGMVNARRLARVVEVDVPLSGLPPALQGFTIAQITDVHVGPTIKRKYLRRIVERVNSLTPDLIAVTGDVVDGSVRDLAQHTAPLAQLKARHGTYLVTGNHEYYSGGQSWVDEFERLGLRVLMNEHVILDHGGAHLLVAGVPDYTAHHFDPRHRSDPGAALAGAPPDSGPRILLAHQPRTATAAANAGFDLQLSGHTHGGQFFPWNLFVPFQQPFIAGLRKVRQLWVYTSRGTGYWGPPKRFGAPSEITRLRLIAAD